MEMSEREICLDYMRASKPLEQIKILSELNDCKYEEIEDILIKNGFVIKKREKKGFNLDNFLVETKEITEKNVEKKPQWLIENSKMIADNICETINALEEEKNKLQAKINLIDRKIEANEKFLEQVESFMGW